METAHKQVAKLLVPGARKWFLFFHIVYYRYTDILEITTCLPGCWWLMLVTVPPFNRSTGSRAFPWAAPLTTVRQGLVIFLTRKSKIWLVPKGGPNQATLMTNNWKWTAASRCIKFAWNKTTKVDLHFKSLKWLRFTPNIDCQRVPVCDQNLCHPQKSQTAPCLFCRMLCLWQSVFEFASFLLKVL